VEVRRPVLSVIHRDHDSEEAADLGMPPILRRVVAA
jgi:hypothetical protein